MKNRVDLVNRELHSKFFQIIDPQSQQQQLRHQRHQNLPEQIMIKNLIKKGLSTTTNSFKSRSKTVKNILPQIKASKSSLKNFQQPNPIRQNQQNDKNKNLKSRYGITLSAGMQTYVEKPLQKFEEFTEIINKIQYQRANQAQRRKIKLEKYKKNKFVSWRKSCVQTEGIQKY